MSTALTLFRRENFSIIVDDEGLRQRDEAIASASLVQVVRDAATQEVAVEVMKGLKSIADAAEKTRKAIKDPVLELGKRIDSVAREFAMPAQSEYTRVNDLVLEYQTEQRRAAEAIERQRQAEIEAERKRLEAEAREKERERLRVEEEKRREIAEAELAAKKARELKAVSEFNAEAARLAEAEAERLKAAEAERLKDEEAKRQEEAAKRTELLEQKRAELGPPAEAPTADGQSVREQWDFEILDIHKLYLSRGQQCVDLSVKRAAVLSLINAAGVRDVPGLKIFKVTKNQVRAGRSVKAIDV